MHHDNQTFQLHLEQLIALDALLTSLVVPGSDGLRNDLFMLRTNSTHGPIQPIKVVRIFPALHIY